MAFAHRLKEYRLKSKMTQKELAGKICVSQKAISSWEVGRSEPTMKEVTKLCKVLDCTIEDLTDTRKRNIGEITKEDILIKINDLDINDLEEIDDLIQKRVEDLKQYAMFELQKQSLEKQLAEMTARVKAYEDKINEHKKTPFRQLPDSGDG